MAATPGQTCVFSTREHRKESMKTFLVVLGLAAVVIAFAAASDLTEADRVETEPQGSI